MDSINLNKENGLKLWATDWNKLISTINLIIDKINTQEGSTSITKLSQLINDSGFITEEDVSGKANKSELARVATSGSYNDLIDKPSQEASAQGPEGKSAYQVAVDNGFVGTEQEWLASLKGEAGQNGLNGQDGSPGQNGLNGITPHIDSSTKHWFIGETDTNILAEGQNGTNGNDGHSPVIASSKSNGITTITSDGVTIATINDGQNGTNGTNGTNGINGITPHIDPTTKHWMIGETDTGVVAEGQDGAASAAGADGKSAYLSYLDTTSDDPVLTEVLWVASLHGQDGSNGTNGTNGVTPHIDLTTGNWFIGSTDTGVLALGPPGQNGTNGTNGTNGITPHIDSSTKHWMIGETDTGIVAEGLDGLNGTNGTNGTDGVTPHIDSTTGNWFIGNTDTGVHALGPAGQGGSGSGVLSDWNETDNTSLAYIANKPTIPTVPANETATSGGNTLSVVTTGDKYNWNNKANIWQGTQAQYDTLSPNYDSNTIYIITAAS